MKVESSTLNNLFDQYDVEENAVTNAFLQTLAGDKDLLKDFLWRYFKIRVGENSTVTISSQKKPSSSEDSGGEKEKPEGRPDGWIIIDDSKADDSKAIAFEVKIKRAAINREQLRKHSNCFGNYNEKFICVITPDEENHIPELKIENVSIKWLSWREIYNFIGNEKRKYSKLSEFLTKQLKEYLSMKKDLVGFQGINYPSGYNYKDAKIILKNLINEIKPEIEKKYPELEHKPEEDRAEPHEYQVYHDSVWSFLAKCENHTEDIHFTFWLAKTHMGIGLTVPNNAKDRWKRLNSIFRDNFEEFKGKLFEIRGKVPHLYLEFVHRHFIPRKKPRVDGIIEMDFDTLEGKKPVIKNEKWLSVIKELIENRKGTSPNTQFMVLTRLFYENTSEMKDPEKCKNTVVQATEHFKDIYNYLTR